MLKKTTVYDMTRVAMCTVIIILFSWTAIVVGALPFTLQTLGIFLALELLGGKLGSLSVFTYIALGALGVPVFSGFSGGISVLAGPTGGYITGFLAGALLYWLMTSVFKGGLKIRVISLVLALVVCYVFGTAWFALYTDGSKDLAAILSLCVFPFIIPDLFKLFFAVFLSLRIKKYIR